MFTFYIENHEPFGSLTKNCPKLDKNKSIYILLGAFFWNTGWYFLRVLKVFHEPLGESNTERRVKISAGISKEDT